MEESKRTNDWQYAKLIRESSWPGCHLFPLRRLQGEVEIEMIIHSKGDVTPTPGGAMQFFAQAEKQTNQKVGPYTPSAWGRDARRPLSVCPPDQSLPV
jgi:hypothetical protein